MLQDVVGTFLDCLSEPEGDFTLTCALDKAGAGAVQSCAVHISIRMLAGWKWCRKK